MGFTRAELEAFRDRTLPDLMLWVLPNPSGLNAHETPDSLAAAYRAAAVAAGLDLAPPGETRTS